MQKISNAAELQATIRELELKTKQQEQELKLNAKSTARSLKPSNLIRVGLTGAKQVGATRDIRSLAFDTFIGMAAGYVTRKIVVGRSRNIFKRTIGAAVQAAIIKMVYRNLPMLKHKTANLISRANQAKFIKTNQMKRIGR
ncbi:MAG: hypothetical protein WKF97_00455 [Chitinophagaceae bacterium]